MSCAAAQAADRVELASSTSAPVSVTSCSIYMLLDPLSLFEHLWLKKNI